MLRESFNDDWFVKDETPGRNDTQIVGPVRLPYDCMHYENRDPSSLNGYNMGFYPGGVYRYSKTWHVPSAWKGRIAKIEFEGVYHRSQVFVNGRLMGGRPNGYTLFHIDMSEAIKYDAENRIEVVAHNADSPNARWYTGSGIYRPVHLLLGGRDHIAPFGLRVTTKSVIDGEAVVEMEIHVNRQPGSEGALTISSEVFLERDDARYRPSSYNVIAPGSASTVIKQLVVIPGAELWSPDSPRLYGAIVKLVQDDEIVDQARDTFGIRILALDAEHGLRVNGIAYKLRGGCIHHDNGVIGAHTLEVAEERRIRLLKEAGYNAIRSAHNPISMALLRACDKYGLLVMNELCDQWFKPKIFFDYTLDFVDWWERDLVSMIRSSYNHPSVIMHSIGNEIMETATAEGLEQTRKMAEVVRREDPTRYLTNAINGFMNMIAGKDVGKVRERPTGNEPPEDPMKNTIAVLNMLIGTLQVLSPYMMKLPIVDRKTKHAFKPLDICGYNYMWGRYEQDVIAYPDRIIVGSETGSKNLVYAWPIVEKYPQILGDFVWTAWDYIGEAGIGAVRYNSGVRIIYPWPARLSGQCVFDITGLRQTQSYNNEYIWGTRSGVTLAVKPVPHGSDTVVVSTWRLTDSIRSWSWEGYEGKGTWVEVYSDAPKVELRLNGVSTTWFRQRTGPSHGYMARFWVKYQPGTLTAIAFNDEGQEIAQDTLYSAGSSLRLTIRPEVDTLKADGDDLAFIPIEITDDAGVLRPLQDRQVTVTVEGAGQLLGIGNADAFSPEGFSSGSHRSYHGRVLAVVRAGTTTGEIKVNVSAEDCEDAVVVIPVKI